jgi:hypothetical protein
VWRSGSLAALPFYSLCGLAASRDSLAVPPFSLYSVSHEFHLLI